MEIHLRAMEHEGKAKRMYATADPNLMVMEFKDDLTAFDALKKGSFAGKGVINNAISAFFFTRLNRAIIPTHFVQMLDPTRTLVRRVEIVQLEVIFRFRAAGSICKRYGVDEGHVFETPLLEFGLKDDALHDPFFADTNTAVEMGICSYSELRRINYLAPIIAHQLRLIYDQAGIELWDGKLEFGRLSVRNGGAASVILADEVSADTCRLTNKVTGEKLDKDLFRFDLGNIGKGYATLMDMLGVEPEALMLASCIIIPAVSGEAKD